MIRRWLFGLGLILFTTAGQAQVVTLPDDVARYYLEQNERVKILTSTVDNLRKEIVNLKEQVITQVGTVEQYEEDKKTHAEQIELKKEELTHQQDLLKEAKKEIKRLKFKIVITYITAGVLVVVAWLLNG